MRFIKIFLSLLIFAISLSFLQAQNDPLKTEALKQMQGGRYGEAIDLLKKYTSSYPQRADGYHLLGQCYEKRGQLESAVYYYRLATKIEPGNANITNDLNRLTRNWQDEIYTKIKGHQREIAVNPRIAVNYLEIGKCYKNLGDWFKAEEWYDKYLSMEEPSPDEVIRYTEINGQTRNLVKGEIILKRFVEKFPNDHRLWSRYGYFTFWLGKNAIAKDAFQKALALRPYFKEAQDGLDQVLGKGYDYTYHDTTAMKNSQQQQQQQQQQQEYAIDKYYRMLKANMADNVTRTLLIEELLKENRLEEALTEVNILKKDQGGDAKVDELYARVTAKREEAYKKIIADFSGKYTKNPADKESLLKMTQYYSYLSQYDAANQLLQAYFKANPNETDLSLRFQYANIATQMQDYYTAIEQLEYCLSKDPNNIDFKLLRGLIAVWMGQESEIEMAHKYLKEVITKDPGKIDALVGLAALETHLKNFNDAAEYIEKVKKINPSHPEIAGLESNLQLMKLRAEEEELFASLNKGRELYKTGDCAGAVAVYQEFFQKHKGNPTIKKEFGYLNFCAKNYDVAISTFTEVLAVNYDYQVDLDRSKAYFEKGDYEKATLEFQRLIASNNADFAANLYLGDCFAQLKKYDEASDLYYKLRDSTKDSTQIALIDQRIGWLPVTGIASLFQSFPSYFLVSPSAFYYADNLDFTFYTANFGVELGVTDYLSIGASGGKGQLKSAYIINDFNIFKANAYFRPLSYLLIGASVGSQNFLSPTYTQPYFEFFARAEKSNFYRIQASYFKQDAAQVLYSPNLVGLVGTKRLLAQMYKIDGYFMMKTGWRISTAVSYIKVDDGNNGTNFEVRLGKLFNFGLLAGYEYNSVVFGRKSIYYFSPQDYESHSLFADWKFYNNKMFELSAGGRVGLIPKSSYWLREVFAYFLIKPIDQLSIQIKVGASNTIRDQEGGYSSRSISASIFYTL